MSMWQYWNVLDAGTQWIYKVFTVHWNRQALTLCAGGICLPFVNREVLVIFIHFPMSLGTLWEFTVCYGFYGPFYFDDLPWIAWQTWCFFHSKLWNDQRLKPLMASCLLVIQLLSCYIPMNHHKHPIESPWAMALKNHHLACALRSKSKSRSPSHSFVGRISRHSNPQSWRRNMFKIPA